MDQALDQFVSFGTLLLAMAVYIIAFFIKRITETAYPKLGKKVSVDGKTVVYNTGFARWWKEVILYAIPVLVGASFGILKAPLLFGENIQTMSGRILFGGVVGWLSGFVYNLFKRVLGDKASAVIDATKPGD
jgi:hypothetical protein